MSTTVMRFTYSNAAGEISQRTLIRWSEAGHYIKGYANDDGRVLTFRKDRVMDYLDGCDALLRNPIAEPPPRLERARPADSRPEILFTGFARVQRSVLEERARQSGLQVMQTVTKHLTFLCCGPTAGPAKVERSREQGVYVLTEPDFFLLAETGELPDNAVEALS